MSKTTVVLVMLFVILGVIFYTATSFASRGYGYMGYYGYHSSPSFWYFGGPSVYYDRSVRGGSVSGSGVRGGGPGTGK